MASERFLHTGGLILAGGKARRFGAEKAVAALHGVPLIEHVANTLAPCATIAVSAPPSSAAARWAGANGYEVLADDAAHASGPLAGVAAGLRWAAALNFSFLATAPCDTPLLPADLTHRLHAAIADANAARAATRDGDHPLCALWRVTLLEQLERALASGRHPPVHAFLADQNAVRVPFADARAFANANTIAELAALEDHATKR